MYTKVLKLKRMIDAMEVRDVSTADIPGAFLQTYYDKRDIKNNMDGAMVTLLKEINPD